MKTWKLLSVLVATMFSVVLQGCGEENEGTTARGVGEGDEHDDHGHSHGVVHDDHNDSTNHSDHDDHTTTVTTTVTTATSPPETTHDAHEGDHGHSHR